MIHLGDVPASSTLYIPFATYGKTNGESITLTGLAVTDIEIYKNGSVTQRASDNGYALLDTDGIDFDGITGIHGFSVDLSDNSDSGFYAAGSFYWVVVSAVTIDSQTVNFIAATFRIRAAEATAGYPVVTGKSGTGTGEWNLSSGVIDANVTKWSGTAVAAVDTAGYPKVTVKSGTGTGEISLTSGVVKADLETIKTQTVTCAAGVTVLASVGTAATSTAQTGDGYAIVSSGTHGNAAIYAKVDTEVASILSTLGTPNGASIADDIAVVNGDTDAIQAKLLGIVLANGTIGATGNDTTHVHIPTFTYGDDEINNWLLVIYDVSETEYHARWIEDWVNSSKLATVATLPFSPAASTDGYFLLPIRQDVTGGSGLDAAGVRAAIGMASADLDTQLDNLDGRLPASLGANGNIKADLRDIIGVAQSATDLKDFADTGYDPATHKAAANISDATADVALKSLTIINSAGTALHCESSGSSGDGIYAKGNGTNDGLHCVGGATGVGLVAQGGSTSGAGISVLTTSGTGISVVAASGLGVSITGGGTSNGVNISGGATSGHGISIATFAGDGINIAAEGGHGAILTATGSSKHGIFATGGDAGTSHGMRLQAGSGGQGLRVDTFTASGATTLTGAVTASNASNSITGVALTSSYDFAKGTTAVTESYSTDGAAPTPVQALMLILQALTEFEISGTTLTINKLNGTDPAATLTLDSSTSPTSATRSG